MASIIYAPQGEEPRRINVRTARELRARLGADYNSHVLSVSGRRIENDDHAFSDEDFVSLSKPSKGG